MWIVQQIQVNYFYQICQLSGWIDVIVSTPARTHATSSNDMTCCVAASYLAAATLGLPLIVSSRQSQRVRRRPRTQMMRLLIPL